MANFGQNMERMYLKKNTFNSFIDFGEKRNWKISTDDDIVYFADAFSWFVSIRTTNPWSPPLPLSPATKSHPQKPTHQTPSHLTQPGPNKNFGWHSFVSSFWMRKHMPGEQEMIHELAEMHSMAL